LILQYLSHDGSPGPRRASPPCGPPPPHLRQRQNPCRSIGGPYSRSWVNLRPRAAKIIGPLGLALIAGSSDLVSPTATIDALFPAFLFLAFWYGQAALMFLLLGFETKGRSIEEINRALDTRAFVALDPVRMPAQ
jgi:hypothetical protein